ARGQRLRQPPARPHRGRVGELSTVAACRIGKARYGDAAMSGVGAYRSGGRWNSPGHHAVYASGHLSLAMLELLVHVDDAEAFLATPHVYLTLAFPDDAVAVIEAPDLPPGWDPRPEPPPRPVAR